LTAGVALAKAGIPFEIHEQAPELKPLGFGLTLQPNAMAALRRLDLGETVMRSGSIVRGSGLWRWDGAPIQAIAKDQLLAIEQEVGGPIVGIRRPTLHEILLDAAGHDRLHLGRTMTGYRNQGDHIAVQFGDGSEIEARALIAADGIHSVARKQFADDGEPIFAGYGAYRGVTSEPATAGDFGGEGWGRGLRFGGCVVDGGRFYWFAVVNGAAGAHDEPGTVKQKLLDLFGKWVEPVPSVIRATDEAGILRTDIHDRTPIGRWTDGKMALLGDAAHAMTPNFGQGACQAIEDALVLGVELKATDSVDAALKAYEKKRVARANAITVGARRLGAIGQWQNPLAVALRDTLFRMAPPSLPRKQLLWAWKLPY
jgi:2-polyprenyl-6-methoxyphenol hydroxylase-like FAD-dependent oxidoreductase